MGTLGYRRIVLKVADFFLILPILQSCLKEFGFGV